MRRGLSLPALPKPPRPTGPALALLVAVAATLSLGGGLVGWVKLSDDVVWGVPVEPPQAWLALPPAGPVADLAEPTTITARPAVPPASPMGLTPAPDPALLETGPSGPLPRIAADGREAWQVYGRPFDARDRRPRIAIVVGGLGLSNAASEAAIEQLPGGVTLSFAPYANGLEAWIGRARAAGHEVLLDLPMEPQGFPRDDPGPYTLLTALSPEQNIERLEWVLSRVTGYVGVNNRTGSRFAASAPSLRPVFDSLKRRGLLFLDGRTGDRRIAAELATDLALPYAANDSQIDAEANRFAIDGALAALEQQARDHGVAVAMASAYPVSLERLAHWSGTLEHKGIALVPLTAVVERGPGP
jgi:polysaccharide deacetylase 2 family uncharacterized protein YibQ